MQTFLKKIGLQLSFIQPVAPGAGTTEEKLAERD
jgi:hypothetical protein